MSARERPREAELRVAEFVRRAGDGLIGMPLRDIAQRCGVSDATVVRYCRHEGYRGLKEYKIALSRRAELKSEPPLRGDETLCEIRRRVTEGSVQALYETGEKLSLDALEQAAGAILASGTLDIYAAGGSAPIAAYLRHQLIKLGIRASIYSDPSSMRLSYAGFERRAAVLSISSTGETQDVVAAQRAAAEEGCETICLTARPDSSLASVSRWVLTAVGGDFLGDSTFARIAQLAVADMLFAAIYRKKKT